MSEQLSGAEPNEITAPTAESSAPIIMPEFRLLKDGEKFGIENLLKLEDLGLEIGNVAGHWASKEGKGAMELFRLTDEIMALPSVDLKLLDDEFKDISNSELLQMQQRAEAKFDIPQDKLEFVVKRSIAMGWKVAGLIKDGFEIASMVKALNAEKEQE